MTMPVSSFTARDNTLQTKQRSKEKKWLEKGEHLLNIKWPMKAVVWGSYDLQEGQRSR